MESEIKKSGCNDITICREDMLPFHLADAKIKKHLKVNESAIMYSTCKNMLGYCTLANGCFIIGAVLHLKENEVHKVYKIGKQHLTEENLHLPPGCFLDDFKVDKTSDLEGLFFVENLQKESWFCKSSLFSHYPLPHSLGDLKTDDTGVINFISDQIKCGLDHWRDLYCYMPDSFIKDISDYCVKNSESNLGYVVTRKGDVLSWDGRDMISLKLTCDRDLRLKHSSDHCANTHIDVWDTQNELDDYLMTVESDSINRQGIITLPKSIHSEIHSFPCDGKPYNTIIYSLTEIDNNPKIPLSSVISVIYAWI